MYKAHPGSTTRRETAAYLRRDGVALTADRVLDTTDFATDNLGADINLQAAVYSTLSVGITSAALQPGRFGRLGASDRDWLGNAALGDDNNRGVTIHYTGMNDVNVANKDLPQRYNKAFMVPWEGVDANFKGGGLVVLSFDAAQNEVLPSPAAKSLENSRTTKYGNRKPTTVRVAHINAALPIPRPSYHAQVDIPDTRAQTGLLLYNALKWTVNGNTLTTVGDVNDPE